jgi:hypothetical protein
MELNLGCADFSDDEFLSAFEECRLNPARFHHADHIRLAWLCVKQYGVAAAEERVLSGIRKFANHAGVPGKFLHTSTVAWVRLVAAARKNAPPDQPFAEWIAVHPKLLTLDLLDRHYSKGRLESPEARIGWVDPDLAPIGS